MTARKRDLPTDITDREIGQRIRTYRRAANITLKGMADYLGVTFHQVQKYESGKNRVAARTLIAISTRLNVSPMLLLLGDEQDQQTDLLTSLTQAWINFRILRNMQHGA